MRIKITTLASVDFDEIREYLVARSPAGLRNVLDDIETSIISIPNGLLLGRKTPRDDVREKITQKYGYIIPYFVKGDTLYILRVYHPRRRPLDYGNIVKLR